MPSQQFDRLSSAFQQMHSTHTEGEKWMPDRMWKQQEHGLVDKCLPSLPQKKKSKSFQRLFYNRKFVRIQQRLCPYQFTWMKGNNKKQHKFLCVCEQFDRFIWPRLSDEEAAGDAGCFQTQYLSGVVFIGFATGVRRRFFPLLSVYVFISFIKLEHTYESSVCRRVDSNFFFFGDGASGSELEPFLRSLTIYFDMSNWLSPIN